MLALLIFGGLWRTVFFLGLAVLGVAVVAKQRSYVYKKHGGFFPHDGSETKKRPMFYREGDAFYYEPLPQLSPLDVYFLTKKTSLATALAAEIIYLQMIGYIEILSADKDSHDYLLVLKPDADLQKLPKPQLLLLAALFSDKNKVLINQIVMKEVSTDFFAGTPFTEFADKILKILKRNQTKVNLKQLSPFFYVGLQSWLQQTRMRYLQEAGFLRANYLDKWWLYFVVGAYVIFLIITTIPTAIFSPSYWLVVGFLVLLLVLMTRLLRYDLTAKGSHYRHLALSLRRYLKLSNWRAANQENGIPQEVLFSFSVALGLIRKQDGSIGDFVNDFTRIYQQEKGQISQGAWGKNRD